MTKDLIVSQLKHINKVLNVNEDVFDDVTEVCRIKVLNLIEYSFEKHYINEMTYCRVINDQISIEEMILKFV